MAEPVAVMMRRGAAFSMAEPMAVMTRWVATFSMQNWFNFSHY
jgi:hypothetical protein